MKKKIGLFAIILTLFIVANSLFKTVIEEKDIRLKEKTDKIVKLEATISTYKKMEEKYNKNEDITIIKGSGKDKIITKIKRKINKNTKSLETSKTNISKNSKTKTSKDFIDKTKTITNPKNLGIGIGFHTVIGEHFFGSYDVFGNLFIYGIGNKTGFGGGVGFKF